MDAPLTTALADPLKDQPRAMEEYQRLERTSPRAMARMRFDLDWVSPSGRHRDSLVATKLNLWRDLFPPVLESQVMSQPVGTRLSHGFAPGELTGPWQERLLIRVPNQHFDRRFTRRGYVQPRSGRFYPAVSS